MTILEALSWAAKLIGQESPQLDAEVLLLHIMSLTDKPARPAGGPTRYSYLNKAWLYANPEKKLTKLQITSYQLLVTKRVNNWPVAYLTGHKEFFGLAFQVNKNVLIPRPETEILVELGIERIKSQELRVKNVIDIGTGSGCIIIALAKKLALFDGSDHRTVKFYATDSSKKALDIAEQNARKNQVLSKIKFIQGDLLHPLPLVRGRLRGGHSNLIIANLPYLTDKQMKNPELKHEPGIALKSGRDGLDHYRKFFEQLSVIARSEATWQSRRDRHASARASVRDDMIVLIEHDPAQKTKLIKLISHHFPQAKIKSHKDLAGKYRIIEIHLK